MAVKIMVDLVKNSKILRVKQNVQNKQRDGNILLKQGDKQTLLRSSA